jgi:signal transduction histidine kinase
MSRSVVAAASFRDPAADAFKPGLRVLVVEDSPTQTAKLQAILEFAGLEVACANDGEQALGMLEGTPIDLVISDIVMPGMSGYDLCRRIKALPASAALPVVLLSAHKDPMDIIRGLECGADGFLPKPYQPEQIIDRVRTIFANRELRANVSEGVQIAFLGEHFEVTARTEQILDLLISTFEDAVWTTRELQRHEAELAEAKGRLERYAHALEGRVEDSAAEAHNELARTDAELKARLAERTVERDDVARAVARTELTRTNIAENAFRQHTNELEELNADLESFSYSVSHDLRAPVRAILGYARAIEEDYASQLDDEGRRLLSVVQSEAARMGELIDDLLDFSRLGRQPMVDGVVNMTLLAREVGNEEALAVDKPDAIFRIADMPEAHGDSVLLRQVWVNLLSNAVKYSGNKANPQLDIWATSEPTQTVYHVRDDGVGFDMAYADKLFGVFQRLHRSDDFPGTGVGLAIVKRIVQRHGGTVWADAKLGEGATFSFALPFGAPQ